MSTSDKRPPRQRQRGPNIATSIKAAAEAGRRLVEIVTEPNGVIKYKFAEDDLADRSGRDAIEA
jgi:hypothetical protein